VMNRSGHDFLARARFAGDEIVPPKDGFQQLKRRASQGCGR
jgi:hypothetical protein